MAYDDTRRYPASPHVPDDQQNLTIARFVRATLAMRDIDELFAWITNLMIQRFRAHIAQFWTIQQMPQASFFLALRSVARQNQSLPQPLIANPQMAAAAENALRENRPPSPEPVDMTFPPPFALFLHQYGLHYHMILSLSRSDLFLPAVANGAGEQLPTPLAMILMLFFPQVPFQQEIIAIDDIFQKIVPIAKTRGFLLASPANILLLPTPQNETQGPDFLDCTVHRHEDPAHNPLASSVVIEKGSARRFYAAIDGQRTVRELGVLAHLEREEAAAIVRKLLAQDRITLYRPDGQEVERSHIFGDP